MKNVNGRPRIEFNSYPMPKDGGVVRGRVNGTECDCYGVISKIIANNCPSFVDDETFFRTYMMRSNYSSMARVNTDAGDTFVEEVGKELASERLFNKYRKDFSRNICKALNELRAAEAAFLHYAEKNGLDISKASTVDQIKQKRYGG